MKSCMGGWMGDDDKSMPLLEALRSPESMKGSPCGLKLFLQQLVPDTHDPPHWTRTYALTLQQCHQPDHSQNDPSIIWILTISMRNWPRFLCSCHTFPKKRTIRLKPYNRSFMMVHLKVWRKGRIYIMIKDSKLTCLYYRDC